MARYAGRIKVRRVMAGLTGHAGRANPDRSAYHEGLMGEHAIDLRRPLGRRIVNAVYHATGVRVRQLPIRLEKLLSV
jgi:hypothetical protein